MIRIAVCDDNPNERSEVEAQAKSYFDAGSQAYELDLYESALDLLANDKAYDLYLLDVLMPGCDGVSAAKAIREKDQNAIIVFITSNLDSAVEGYRVEASGFLLKPLTAESFVDTMDRLAKRGLIGTIPTLSVVSKHTPLGIPLSQIVMLESDLHQVYIYTIGETVTVNQRLSKLEEQIADYPEFLRCHQSFLVNLNYVDDILEGSFMLKDSAGVSNPLVPISRSRYKYCKMEFYQYRLNRLR